ncbi:MAG: outer membrane beta-barrel protein [Verrucomicrobiota bacterium]
MKNLFLSAGLFCAPLSTVFGSPLLSIGDHADLFAELDGSVAYTDNLTLDASNELDDVRFIVQPGLALEIGRGLTNVDASLNAMYGFVRYADNSDFDTELWNVVGNAAFRGPRYNLGVSGGYIEKQQNENDVNAVQTLVLQQTAFANGNIRYELSEKFALGVAGRFDNITYDGGNNLDRDIYAVPVDLFYELTPKLDASVGFRYRQTDVESGQDFDDYFYNLGLTGALTEKFSTTARIGYQEREFDGSNDSEGTLTLISSSDLDVSPRATARLVLNRDFATSGDGQSVERTSVRGTLFYLITPKLTTDITGSYTVSDYQTSSREDDTYLVRLGGSYRFNSLVSLNAFYTYRDNDSNLNPASYTENLFQVGASLRY